MQIELSIESKKIYNYNSYRSLKLGNLFLNDKMELKVADFGLAAKVEFEGEKKRLEVLNIYTKIIELFVAHQTILLPRF